MSRVGSQNLWDFFINHVRNGAVGTLEACQQAAPGAHVRDLGNTVLMPGFIDPHSHPLLGGIVTQEAPIHISNVMLVDGDTKRATRVGFRKQKVDKTRPDGTTYQVERNVRIARRSGEDI